MARPRGNLDRRAEAAQVLQRLKREPAGWRRERLLAVKLGLEGQLTLEEIADQLGRARSCVQRWLERFRRDGLQGLLHRPEGGKGPASRERQEVGGHRSGQAEGVCSATVRRPWNSLRSTPDLLTLSSTDYVNVVVCDKQSHLQYLDREAAIAHCTKGLGIWEWASTDRGEEPDVVLVGCGDIPTQEALAASVLLRKEFPKLKIRFINVVDLLKLQPATEHPHGLPDRDFDGLFTIDKPITFNFHAYPWLIHRLTYRRTNHHNLHVRGYKEKGNINTPLELAIQNEIDRFSIAMDVIDRVPWLRVAGAHAKERFKNEQIDCCHYAYANGVDKPEVLSWKWPL